MDRRDFLKSGVGLSALSLGAGAFAAPATKIPRVGLIGTGWYGKIDLLRLIQVAPVEVVGLCDVDSKMAAEAATIVSQRQASGKKPTVWGDYRQMLKEQEFDIMLIDTPDHWHALPMIDCVNRGIDVWVQKPISVEVIEGLSMVTAARKKNRVVQVGAQCRQVRIHSSQWR
jgi:predicted dehydrogenase